MQILLCLLAFPTWQSMSHCLPSCFPGLRIRPEEMTLVGGEQWTDYECVHCQKDHTGATYSCYAHASGVYGHLCCSHRPAGANMSLLLHRTNLSDASRANQNLRILLAFLFFILCTRILKMCCSLLACAYCICQHLMSCGHCCFGFD